MCGVEVVGNEQYQELEHEGKLCDSRPWPDELHVPASWRKRGSEWDIRSATDKKATPEPGRCWQIRGILEQIPANGHAMDNMSQSRLMPIHTAAGFTAARATSPSSTLHEWAHMVKTPRPTVHP